MDPVELLRTQYGRCNLATEREDDVPVGSVQVLRQPCLREEKQRASGARSEHETSVVRTPQQNGRVERKHLHILRALKFQAHLLVKFWRECVLTAGYLINRMLTATLRGRTPYELLYGVKASYHLTWPNPPTRASEADVRGCGAVYRASDGGREVPRAEGDVVHRWRRYEVTA